MEIKTEDYQVGYDAANASVVCKGSFMLSGTEEYAPILELLTNAANEQAEQLSLDLRGLEFLNSSGINTLTKFVIFVRKKQTLQLKVQGYESVPWQVRLLKNLQRLLPRLVMELD